MACIKTAKNVRSPDYPYYTLTGHCFMSIYYSVYKFYKIISAGLQTWDVYWPAKMMDIDKIVMFHLQFWDAGENS